MQGAALLASPANITAASPCATFLRSSSNVRCTSRLPSRSLRKTLPNRIRAQQQDQDYVKYDEKKSVFPAEACEEVGGEACEAEGVGPEVRGSASTPKQQSSSKAESGTDREYVDYKESKTVFPGEACDDLGGEFCEPEYQAGVFPEKAAAKK
ncbi:hypothetical protein L7F22_029993 [Adiantum nelumboides]|nr:hypothetical protein [Adiantum nelumboides]